MTTVEARYAMATAYARRAIAAVETTFTYFISPITGLVEWYAGITKTAVPRNELAHVEARWRRSTTDGERALLAREAELLADRIEETLPGAPQDRKRTNLFVGERAQATPDNSYLREFERQAEDLLNAVDVFGGANRAADRIADGAAALGRWLLVSAGIVASWKLVGYLRAREHNRTPQRAGEIQDVLNRRLSEVPTKRSASGSSDYFVRAADDTDAYYVVVGDAADGRALLVPLTDDARDRIADHTWESFTATDGTKGDGYVDSLAFYERVYRLPRSVLQ